MANKDKPAKTRKGPVESTPIGVALPAIAVAFCRWLLTTREARGVTRYGMEKAGWVKAGALKALEDRGHDPKLSTFVAACRGLGQNPATVLAKLLKEVE